MTTPGGVIERYELKYRLPPEAVAPLRQSIARYCEPDAVAAGGRYTISSLYLDTPDLRLYHDTIEQLPRRYKLRVRRYATGPFFLETKRRLKDVIHKSRVAVPANSWPALILDPQVESSLELVPTRREELSRFVARVMRIGATPAVLVRYEREAWSSSVDEYARVTFDTQLSGRAPDGWEVAIDGPGWMPLDSPDRFYMPGSGVVLELKCTQAVPAWMIDLARRHGLRREGFSKYGTALEAQYRPVMWRDRSSALRGRRP